ncbi:putative Methyl-accepting chemotaxis sensory transducer [Richelia sinica FACHB-800]|uniref:Methyl-accepting chemotaxis sensory transducer n=1 Tax=Richelia sinica FACHB-800 TaxID=1357546 RepID=A0A975T3S6_9NOST|nr:putative Methyl-accepting chemotaxis sensory transducer [Richelia sinica FACHB-800]
MSLNAAIEAEKAGEYGLGFAVVAREIRRLADQTAVATIDIEQMVKQMQSSVSTGVMEMDKFATEVSRSVEDVANISMQMGQIIEQVQDLTPRYEAVSQGMEAQAQGATQISDAMSQLSSNSVQTAASLREINQAIAQLNQIAQGLRQEMSRFKLSNSTEQQYIDHSNRLVGSLEL